MNATEEVKRHLPRLCYSYAAKQSSPFRHFFCPLLLKDDDVDLCMGHVVPASLSNCCRARVVQRADVDNFYGAVAEAEFATLFEARGSGLKGLMFDEGLRRRVRPRIVVDGEEVPHYTFTGRKSPAHSLITLEHAENGGVVDLVLAKSPEELLAAKDRNWSLVVERDCRIAALVTLIKSAYLTLFRMLGYRWALSAAGLSVGYDVLGRFYRENCGKTIAEAKKAAKGFFAPFKHMVPPIMVSGDGLPMRGTVEDNQAGVCFGSSGRPFALTVCVRVDCDLHAVLMPAFAHPDAVEAYWGFLNNEKELVRISNARFDEEKGRWDVHPEAAEAHWPKKSDTFAFDSG